jgi:hypothetical protein
MGVRRVAKARRPCPFRGGILAWIAGLSAATGQFVAAVSAVSQVPAQ